jgi:4-hydroxythreonine-4-phosphate dehydrogenase
MSPTRIVALTQGDPAGVGPEVVAKLVLGREPAASWRPLVVAERAALDGLRGVLPALGWDRLRYTTSAPSRDELLGAGETVFVLDPVAEARPVVPGRSGAADAGGALAAIDAALGVVRDGVADAMVTAPVSKASIARHHLPDFRGHTGYIASRCGLERYGRDYLMAFLAGNLQVALVTVHQPLLEAVGGLTSDAIFEAAACLERHAGGRIAVAGINPHAGEGGLIGDDDQRVVAPAVERARAAGIDARGPESADSVFARALDGRFDWVLALYHDQGLIAVKTASFGGSVNWTLGLPIVRTSVDHGTGFDLAGRGRADEMPLAQAVAASLALLDGGLPLRRA